MSLKPTFVKNALLPLEQISLEERSGWRPRSDKRIEQLAELFRAGQFGVSCACGVQLLSAEDINGKYLIDDGYSTVAALEKLRAEQQEAPTQVKERSRLESTSASIALRLLLERDLGSKAFSEKICAPLKVVEVWSQLMKKRYGPVCTLSPAFARLLTWLQCYDGLQLAAATMASGAPLHGTCDSNPGIAECRAMIKEFDRCRAGGLPPPNRIPTEKELEEQAKAAKQAQEEAYAARQKAEEAEAAAAREEELAQGWLAAAVSPAPQASQQRPAVDTAEEALKNDLAKVKFFGTPDALVAALAEPLSVCCRAAILIAAPTSGWAAISMYMQTAADLQGAYKAGTGGGAGQHRLRIVVFTGGRLDIIAKVQEKARVLFPNRAAFLTFLQRTQSQTWQSRPSIAVTLLEKQDCNPNIPSTINVPRASPAQVALEGLALRCKAQECPLQAGRSGAEEGLMVEIDPEDREPSALELMQAELADEQDSGDSAEPAGSGVLAEPSALGFVELWPWAQSLAFWDLVYKNLLLADKAQVVAVLSPSAHPGPWVAARRLAADVFVSTRRHSAHAHRHGLQLGEAMRRADLTPAAGPAPAAAQLARGGISATVVGEQVVEAYDIAPGPSWRDGLNLAVAGDVFAKSTARLVDEQLDSLGLALSAAEGAGGAGRALEAARLLRDGTAIPASALFFDDEVALEAWLALPGNAGFRSRIVDIPGVLKEGVERLVRAVLVGAVQHIGSHSGVRKLPNAKFTFIPAKGFNEGALELVICTRNGVGVAKGSPLLVDFRGPASPKDLHFRGALDVLFDQQKDVLPEDWNAFAEMAREEAEAEEAEQGAKRKSEAKEAAAEAKRRKAEEDAAAEEAAAAAAREREAREAAAGVRAAEAPAGEVVATLSKPKSELRWCKGDRSLVLVSLEGVAKKVPKHTILAAWSERIKVSSKLEGGFVWAAAPADLVRLRENSEVMTFAKAMKTEYASVGQIFGYAAFPAGTSPKAYKATAEFKPFYLDLSDTPASERAATVGAIDAARGSKQLKVIWTVKYDDKKQWVRPCGAAIVAMEQFTLQPAVPFTFQ